MLTSRSSGENGSAVATRKLIPNGDWSPRLREVDVVELRPSVPRGALRTMLEGFELNIHRIYAGEPGDLKNYLQGRGLFAPFVVFNLQGVKLGSATNEWGVLFDYGTERKEVEVLSRREIAHFVNLSGRAVLCLGAGLGNPRMAEAFIAGGASAYIGTTDTDERRSASWLFFASRLFHEIARNGATVREAWELASAHDLYTRSFRMYVPRCPRSGSRQSRAIALKRGSGPHGLNLPPFRRPLRPLDWKPRHQEVDLLTVPTHRGGGDEFIRSSLEAFGYKVNIFSSQGSAQFRDRLAGHGLSAPIVLINCHGNGGGDGDNNGIITEAVVKEGKKSYRWISRREIARCVHLPGRVVVATCCGLGAIPTAQAFLGGKLRAYGATWGAHVSDMFVVQFFYDLAINGCTMRRAWERARTLSDEVAGAPLWPRGARVVRRHSPHAASLRAPAKIEGFEPDTSNYCEGDWDALMCGLLMGKGVPAPAGRPGFAYKLHFDFDKKEWPWLTFRLSPAFQRWEHAKALTMEVYVPHTLPLCRPLTCVLSMAGEKQEYAIPRMPLARGWNLLRLPFDSRAWEGRIPDKTPWRREAFDLGRVQPVVRLWFALEGRGRKEEGYVYLDNVRLE